MAKSKAAPGMVRARVLTECRVDGQVHVPDQVIELSADAIAPMIERGEVDPHPDAVAYAESLAAAEEPEDPSE